MRIDEPLEKVVAGTWDRAAAAKKQLADLRLKALTEKVAKEISKAKKEKDFARALQLIDEAVAKESAVEASFGLDKYFLLLDAGRAAEAATYGQRLVAQVIGDDAGKLNQLAWSIVDPQKSRPNGDWPLAVLAAERAVALLGGKDAFTLDTLGLALFKTGQIERAVEVQTKAVELAQGQGEIEKELRARLQQFRAACKDL
jgi:tetratricopeptide (TPR) repeat protein